MKQFQLAAAILLVLVSLFANAAAQDDVHQDGENADRKTLQSETKSTETFRNLAAFVVNDNGDGTDITPGDGICETATGNGVCTLRAAVVEANALAGTDTISFDPGVVSISVNGQITISSNLDIVGNATGVPTVQNVAAAGANSRIFNVQNFAVNLRNLTISGGNTTTNGGGIANVGNLTITDCVISGNTTTAAGGGVRSTGTLFVSDTIVNNNSSTNGTSGGISFAGANFTLSNSTVRNNQSLGNGGGMNIAATVSVTIIYSTISGNTSGAASGGFFTNRGTITNSTISGNTANGAAAADGGGGVRIQATTNSVTFLSCTITGNSAPNSVAGARSGIWHESGTVNISNTIVAANAAQDIQRDGGTLVNNGFNLIGENTSVTTEFPAGLPNGTNYVGTDAAPLDPLLSPLANNGGITETHLPLATSVAVDQGSAFGLSIDQRGFIRLIDLAGVPNAPAGDGTDIGAVEFQSTAPTAAAVSVSGRVTNAFGIGIGKAMVVLTDDSGNSRIAVTGPFGYFEFQNVLVGESYIVSVQSKNYQFEPQLITVNDTIVGLEITALH